MTTREDKKSRTTFLVREEDNIRNSIGGLGPGVKPRAAEPESRLVGDERRDVTKRFSDAESIPKDGVTKPSDSPAIPSSIKSELDVKREDVSGSIGIVVDPNARTSGSRIEPAFVGLERRLGGSLQDTMNRIESIPTKGPTVPADSPPGIMTPEAPTTKAKAESLGSRPSGTTRPNPIGYHGREGRLVGERREGRNPLDKEQIQAETDVGKPKPIQTGFKAPYDGPYPLGDGENVYHHQDGEEEEEPNIYRRAKLRGGQHDRES